MNLPRGPVALCLGLLMLVLPPPLSPRHIVANDHWAYQPVSRPVLPTVAEEAWPRNPMDHFILARLEQEDLGPSPVADRATLLRRVTLDLIGLPPDLEEVDAFLTDNHPCAYEKVVDRLLASPHYGEHWARRWLDLARYADTNGYNIDVPRSMWPYRDWVIRALNDNMPFDQFTIEQLAGDLLPGPTREQLIATGFHRNTMINQEGGVDPEENRAEAVVDRVTTTATVWLGTTFQCAQCHSHKYDPFTQREFFQFYAFFNNCSDEGGGGPEGSLAPVLHLLKPDQQHELERIRSGITALETEQMAREKVQTAEQKSVEQNAKGQSPAAEDPLKKRLEEHRQREAKLLKSVPSSLVMKERSERRITRIHIRGDFLDPGEEVTPAVPAVLHSLPPDKPANRFGLARWLVAPDNPLLGRVTVNRMWQRFFGVGIVSTSDDFGTQGEPPSHPKLLDWLAVELIASGWDVKSMHQQTVMSATYRQSSRVGPELLVRDPYNRLLARGPRLRMEAEMIRDNALAIGGLLNLKLGGPSVYPPQPPGFWLEFGTTAFGMEKWPASRGGDRYRRGLYTFWRRTTTYPSLTTFDAPSRDRCTPRRHLSNTPLQALVTLNDPAFVEANVALAGRMIKFGGSQPEARIVYAFRSCQARQPRPAEVERLLALYRKQRADFRAHPERAAALVAAAPDRLPADTDAYELAAWTVVAGVLLNLDATITKS